MSDPYKATPEPDKGWITFNQYDTLQAERDEAVQLLREWQKHQVTVRLITTLNDSVEADTRKFLEGLK